MKIDILGVQYTVLESNEQKDKQLENSDGYCIFYGKHIIIDDLSDWPSKTSQHKIEKEIYKKQILRHEIIHAFLYESGLAFNSYATDKWAMNEEMVDWISIQFPKILETFKMAKCL